MTQVDHGFDMAAIRRELDKEDWESDPENRGTETRRIYLGTVFGLTPSGKYYLPFACSNLTACPSCKGEGTMPLHRKRRVAKRWTARHARTMARFDKLFGEPEREPGVVHGGERGMPSLLPAYQPPGRHAAYAYIARQPKRFRMRSLSAPPCTACNGMGSREAYLDALWHESCEEAFEAAGINFEPDGEDYFASEYRDAPDEVESPGEDLGDDEVDYGESRGSGHHFDREDFCRGT